MPDRHASSRRVAGVAASAHAADRASVLLPLPLAGAYDYLGTLVFAKAEMLAFSDTFIVIGLVGLIALIPAAMLSRQQRRGRGFALLGKFAR